MQMGFTVRFYHSEELWHWAFTESNWLWVS